MTAAPVPEFTPATATDLGHAVRYPLRIETAGGVEWRAGCDCHTFWWLDPEEAHEAWLRQGQQWNAWGRHLTLEGDR